jgi:F420-dependent oxidoreductase-like protein
MSAATTCVGPGRGTDGWQRPAEVAKVAPSHVTREGLMMILGAIVLGTVIATASPATAGVAFGMHTPQENATFEQLVAAWQEAERLGFDQAWAYDHFAPLFGSKDGPVLEGWTLLAALARETQRIRIGLLVTGNTYRNPAVLAKMATTVDHVSNGRLNFGIGAAWEGYEHTAYGVPFFDARERAERLGEALEVITLLWRGGHPTFKGKYYSLFEAPMSPQPVQRPHPPIVIGGQGPKWIMPLVAKYADEWNVPIGLTPDDVRTRIAEMRAECARIGRSPCVERVSVFLPLISITGVPLAGPATRLAARALVEKRIASSLLVGSASEIRDRLRRYIDAGATGIIVSLRPPFSPELMREFAAEVMPAFR